MRALLLGLSCAFWISACSKPAPNALPEEPEIRRFVDRYFTTWSAQDLAGYGACFHSNARVTYVDLNGQCHTQGLTDFLHSQKLSHAQSSFPMSEVPTDLEISGDGRVSQAAVKWKLTKGPEVVTGLDYFTLVKTPEGWRIISLVFYNDRS